MFSHQFFPHIKNFLNKYGYLVNQDPRTGAMRTKQDLINSIRRFQRYADLNETGEIDAATLAMMAKDRCGVADFSKSDSAIRKRRYTLQGSKWRRKVILLLILVNDTDD